MTSENWVLLNHKFETNQGKYLSIVEDVMFNFFSSIIDSDVPVVGSINHCGFAAEMSNKR